MTHPPAPARMFECVSEYMFLISVFNFKKNSAKETRRQKAKETKKEKRISVENRVGYDDIVCEFDLLTFNLLDRDVNFSWLFI